MTSRFYERRNEYQCGCSDPNCLDTAVYPIAVALQAGEEFTPEDIAYVLGVLINTARELRAYHTALESLVKVIDTTDEDTSAFLRLVLTTCYASSDPLGPMSAAEYREQLTTAYKLDESYPEAERLLKALTK